MDRRRAHERRQLEAGFTRVTLTVASEDVEALKAYARELRQRRRATEGSTLGQQGRKPKASLGEDQ